MIMNFQDRHEITSRLANLSPNTLPEFGLMNPQQMVEHLILVMQISNGKRIENLMIKEETAKKWKEALIYTDAKMPKGFKAPMLPEKPMALSFENLEIATKKLLDEIDDFNLFFSENPKITSMHPALGLFDMNEWVIFHNKHFTHHFEQFGLV